MDRVTDAKRGRIYITARSRKDSKAFIDGQIAALDATREPWRFDRLIDVRDCVGFVDFDDFVRHRTFWNPHIRRIRQPLKVAMITQNARTELRMSILEKLLESHVVRSFPNRDEGEGWLDSQV